MVPRFEPFTGIRYNADRVDLADVTAPPYDVIDDDQRAALAARSPYNAVRIDCPVGDDCYNAAAETMDQWLDDGVLFVDDRPSLYVYRMSFTDEAGHPRSTIGVIGAVGLEHPGEGDVLPHEHTTAKARSDRLELLQATSANLSAVWLLSLSRGLSKLVDPDGTELLGDWNDEDGVRHQLWRLGDDEAVGAVCEAVEAAPLVIADGHHRFETCLTYRDQRRAALGGDQGPYDLTMSYVVELADEALTVQPIHRLLAGLPADFDFLAALSPWFEFDEIGAADSGIVDRIIAAGGLAIVHPHGTRLLRPRPGAFGEVADLDSARLAVALAELPPHQVSFQHGVGNVVAAVETGRAQAGILLRPATVAQIAATANARSRMPAKTTFFWPKVRTGLVFRSLA